MKKEKTEKEKKIAKERARLVKIYKDIEEKKKNTVVGLIERCAFMRVTLEEMECDLNENGLTEMFSQGNQKPYERKRPVAEIYASMNTSYQKAIKQLTDLLPKLGNSGENDDGFDDFVSEREDL